jgi:ferric-dicitrate binding protein FerR (iron transport regulator)
VTPEFVAAVDAALDGRLTPDQARLLERAVTADPAARAYYVECVGLHAALRAPAPADQDLPTPAAPPGRRRLLRMAVAGLAASVCLAAGGRLFGDRLPVAVAALTEAKGCRWEAGTLPTAVGSALPPGRLRLAEGLARIVFADGADVQVEGPADLELVSAGRCVLHAGRLVASVPPPAQGFVVETPTAVVTDWGTEFGVTVGDARAADVQVFRGHVDVTHRATGDATEMRTGAAFRFSPTEVLPFREAGAAGPAVAPPPPGSRLVQISTAQGRGRDAYVQPPTDPATVHDHVSDTLLLVKLADDGRRAWDRRAYLGFDLAPLAGATVTAAELTLTFAPTGFGFSALVPDATFAVYGLTDEAADDWDEAAIDWDTAPAGRGVGEPLDPARVTRLGSFVVPQGVQSGTFPVAGPELAAFLNRDADRQVTLVVVRETAGLDRNDLVHAVASRRHPRLSPPTLRLTVADRPK